jgi:hypothetical protein
MLGFAKRYSTQPCGNRRRSDQGAKRRIRLFLIALSDPLRLIRPTTYFQIGRFYKDPIPLVLGFAKNCSTQPTATSHYFFLPDTATFLLSYLDLTINFEFLLKLTIEQVQDNPKVPDRKYQYIFRVYYKH